MAWEFYPLTKTEASELYTFLINRLFPSKDGSEISTLPKVEEGTSQVIYFFTDAIADTIKVMVGKENM